MRERLLFVGLLISATALVPMVAVLVRRALPGRSLDSPRPLLTPVVYGDSPRTRHSPRHAVLHHRGLVGALLMGLLGLSVLLAVAALPVLGVSVIPAVFAFVLPTLLISLHSRRRSPPH